MFKWMAIGVIVCVAGLSAGKAMSSPVVVDFEDLDYETDLTGSQYAELDWELGSLSPSGFTGYWLVPAAEYSYPLGRHNVINAWGCTQIGIGFPAQVDVYGADFAGQGVTAAWTTGVRVRGYAGGVEIAVTDWFRDIDETPNWFQMSLVGVDRIIIESEAVSEGRGAYGMDNLTHIPEPGTLSLLVLSATAALCRRRQGRRRHLNGGTLLS